MNKAFHMYYIDETKLLKHLCVSTEGHGPAAGLKAPGGTMTISFSSTFLDGREFMSNRCFTTS